jgi:UV DNA damage endonuclease
MGQELRFGECSGHYQNTPWNYEYGIKFMRLSSEMFTFASHKKYGYDLEYAAEVLEEAGRVAARLGYRVTTGSDQFTQLGSPRKEAVENTIRDLNDQNEMLTRPKLPEQQDEDAVMILHMGDTFGLKEETRTRFRTNYARLSVGVKNRLMLENDEVSRSVHDFLPICQWLNIPLMLNFHHHNIIFDDNKVRERTLDIMKYFPAIQVTWAQKIIT